MADGEKKKELGELNTELGGNNRENKTELHVHVGVLKKRLRSEKL